MWERLRNWLSDDAAPEKDDKGWGLPMWWGATIVALFTVAITWCHGPTAIEDVAAATPSTTTAPAESAGPNLLDLIDSRPELSFFRGLITIADLEEAIATGENITFLAPTDAAFGDMPEELVGAMTTDPNVALQVLRIHVTQGKVSLDTLVSAGSVFVAAGLDLPVADQSGTVSIDHGTVVDGDLESTNGVVHTIDAVLGLGDHSGDSSEPTEPAEPPDTTEPTPPAEPLSQLLINRSDLGTFVGALGPVSGSLFANDDGSGFTVFAPTDTAFGALPTGSVDLLLATNPKLLELLGYHVVPGTFLAEDLSDGRVLTTQSGAELPVSVADGVITVGAASVTESDLTGSNGVIHIVDGVLLPPDFELPTLNEALSLESITFETASAVITAEGQAALAATVEFLSLNPDVRVAIEGHTDSEGDEEPNLALSQDRADSVRDYLVEQGIAADRLETEGFGETRPIASNDTPEGRAQNRRIDFRLL
jgi:uncharacterized surface protein with fasciclin (FAS1) repeats